ncbi:IQ domain-containing protein M isoform X2 [Rhineura floridana]|uniref:IQ domain-containing protein M isoform X2 n=1 Tax=Rhineura floridana TaxID=261503 RepID=UPI002AC831EE|nr:IQ domain-containing protein M isoform X2 [Rhineura floridana]
MWRSLQTFLAWGCILHSNLGTLNVKSNMSRFTLTKISEESRESMMDKVSVGKIPEVLGRPSSAPASLTSSVETKPSEARQTEKTVSKNVLEAILNKLPLRPYSDTWQYPSNIKLRPMKMRSNVSQSQLLWCEGKKDKMWLSDVFTRVESLSRSMEREKDKQKRSIGSSNLLGLSSNERNETAWIPKTQYATNIQWHTAFEHGHFKYDIYMACTLTDERKNIPRLERGNIIRDHASVYNAQQPGTSTKINNNNKKAKVQGALTSGKYQKGKAHAGDSEDWKDALQAKSHGSNLLAVVKEYRKMMFRIKRRCGILDPTTPLIFEQLEDWLDHKRFYETMFAKREFLKEMDRNDIPKFFRDCGLFPSPAELNNIMKMVLEGADSKIKIITKTQAIEMAFMLYPPRGLTLITAAAARSTWLKPIVDGEDGYKYLVSGHPVLKAADIRVAGALVAASIRERKRKEREANQSALSGDSD